MPTACCLDAQEFNREILRELRVHWSTFKVPHIAWGLGLTAMVVALCVLFANAKRRVVVRGPYSWSAKGMLLMLLFPCHRPLLSTNSGLTSGSQAKDLRLDVLAAERGSAQQVGAGLGLGEEAEQEPETQKKSRGGKKGGTKGSRNKKSEGASTQKDEGLEGEVDALKRVRLDAEWQEPAIWPVVAVAVTLSAVVNELLFPGW